MTTPEAMPAGLPRRSMIGAGLGVLGGVAALSALTAPKAEAAALEAVYFSQTPERVCDSRIGQGTTQARIKRGDLRTIDMDPYLDLSVLFSFSAILNVTVTRTVGAGHLRLWETGTSEPTTSNVNWFGPGQTLANLAFVGVNSVQESINIRCDGPSAAAGETHFVIDILGYFRGIPLPVERSGEKKAGS